MVLGFFGFSVSGLRVSGFRVYCFGRFKDASPTQGFEHVKGYAGSVTGKRQGCSESVFNPISIQPNRAQQKRKQCDHCVQPACWVVMQAIRSLNPPFRFASRQVRWNFYAAKADEQPHFQASAATLSRQSGKLCTWWLHRVTDWHSSTGLSLWYSKTSPTRPANCLGRPRLSDVLTCQTSSFVLCFRFSQQDPANAKTRAPKHRLQPSGIGNVMSQRKGGVRSKL